MFATCNGSRNRSPARPPDAVLTLVQVDLRTADSPAVISAAAARLPQTTPSNEPAIRPSEASSIERGSVQPLRTESPTPHPHDGALTTSRAEPRDLDVRIHPAPSFAPAPGSAVVEAAPAGEVRLAPGAVTSVRDEIRAERLDRAPGQVHAPPPEYPRTARRRGLEGLVLVGVLVDESGRPAQVALKRSSGHGELDASALRAVGRWRFAPARQGETAVASAVEIPVRFQLNP